MFLDFQNLFLLTPHLGFGEPDPEQVDMSLEIKSVNYIFLCVTLLEPGVDGDVFININTNPVILNMSVNRFWIIKLSLWLCLDSRSSWLQSEKTEQKKWGPTKEKN